jgi:hypothetical protein
MSAFLVLPKRNWKKGSYQVKELVQYQLNKMIGDGENSMDRSSVNEDQDQPQESPFNSSGNPQSSESASWFSCIAPFQDPTPDTEAVLLSRMQERIEKEEFHSQLNATSEEKSEILLKRFLRKHFFDLEVALVQWHAYVEWRHGQKLNEITEDDIKNEREEGIFSWRGENKEGMPCCVITGRMLDPSGRKGTFVSFRKHLTKFVDEGMYRADEVCYFSFNNSA